MTHSHSAAKAARKAARNAQMVKEKLIDDQRNEQRAILQEKNKLSEVIEEQQTEPKEKLVEELAKKQQKVQTQDEKPSNKKPQIMFDTENDYLMNQQNEARIKELTELIGRIRQDIEQQKIKNIAQMRVQIEKEFDEIDRKEQLRKKLRKQLKDFE